MTEIQDAFSYWRRPLLIGLATVVLIVAIGLIGKSMQTKVPPFLPLLRSSLTGIGYVLILYNYSDEPLRNVTVMATDPTTATGKSYVVPLLGPKEKVEVGWLEMGWFFERGEKIAFAVDGYDLVEETTNDILKFQEEFERSAR